MKKNYISFIMPVYNTKIQLLEKSIGSVINQSNPNYELLIIDDGSNDTTKRFLKKYEEIEKVRIIYQENSGVSLARNTGVSKANGEWIAFIDSDDWIEENYVESILKNDNADIDIILFNYKNEYGTKSVKKYIDINQGIIEERIKEYIKYSFIHKLYIDDKKEDYAIETIWNKVYKKRLIDENHLFDNTIKKGEDRIFNLKIFNDYECKISYLDEYLYHYVINEESESNAYCKDIISKTEKTLNCMEEYLKAHNFSQQFYDTLYIHICTRIYSYLRLYYLNKSSKMSFKEIKNNLRKIKNKEIYKNALEKVKLDKIDLKEKIFLFFFKHNMYNICIWLSWLNMKRI